MKQIEVLEAVARLTAKRLVNGAVGWGKPESDACAADLLAMLKAGEVSPETFAAATARLTGNLSQRRQALVSWGLLESKESDSAEKRAIIGEIEKAKAALDALAK